MSAIRGVPHPFPYQGSKRQLASTIVACIPERSRRLFEPFAGSAAISVACAATRRASRFVLNDVHNPLYRLWVAIVERPGELADGYESLWTDQSGREREFYDEIRARFNSAHEPPCFLYLLARCVKAAIRYNAKGEFNNSPDNRRLGMHPVTMRRNLEATAELFRGRVELSCRDYRDTLAAASAQDVIYLDPPYRGVCAARDTRYSRAIAVHEFADALAELNRRRIPYLVSYDGRTGAKVYGPRLPDELELAHFEIAVGRSTQATLLGRDDDTVESLYLSRELVRRLGGIPAAVKASGTPSLFAEL